MDRSHLHLNSPQGLAVEIDVCCNARKNMLALCPQLRLASRSEDARRALGHLWKAQVLPLFLDSPGRQTLTAVPIQDFMKSGKVVNGTAPGCSVLITGDRGIGAEAAILPLIFS